MDCYARRNDRRAGADSCPCQGPAGRRRAASAPRGQRVQSALEVVVADALAELVARLHQPEQGLPAAVAPDRLVVRLGPASRAGAGRSLPPPTTPRRRSTTTTIRSDPPAATTSTASTTRRPRAATLAASLEEYADQRTAPGTGPAAVSMTRSIQRQHVEWVVETARDLAPESWTRPKPRIVDDLAKMRLTSDGSGRHWSRNLRATPRARLLRSPRSLGGRRFVAG